MGSAFRLLRRREQGGDEAGDDFYGTALLAAESSLGFGTNFGGGIVELPFACSPLTSTHGRCAVFSRGLPTLCPNQSCWELRAALALGSRLRGFPSHTPR